MQISEKLRFVRQYRGYSQEELARRLNVSFPTVNSWERGKSQPYPRHQKAIDNLYQEVLTECESRMVLVVEDDQSTGLVLEDYATMALPNWKTMVVDNGYEAILQIGMLKPRIVLLDIMMPEIDGFKVFERISEMEELQQTRVIFVTAATDETVLERARNSGAFALIQKPLKRDEILRVLEHASADIGS